MKINSLKNTLFFMLILFLFTNISFSESPPDISSSLREQVVSEVERAYEQATWDDLSIEFHQVREEPTDGFTPMRLKNAPTRLKDKTYYVSPIAKIKVEDIWGINVFYKPFFEDKLGLIISLNKKGKEKLRDYTSKHISEFLGIVIDGELKAVSKITDTISNGKIQVIRFIPTEAVDIAQRFYKPLKSAWPYMN